MNLSKETMTRMLSESNARHTTFYRNTTLYWHIETIKKVSGTCWCRGKSATPLPPAFPSISIVLWRESRHHPPRIWEWWACCKDCMEKVNNQSSSINNQSSELPQDFSFFHRSEKLVQQKILISLKPQLILWLWCIAIGLGCLLNTYQRITVW